MEALIKAASRLYKRGVSMYYKKCNTCKNKTCLETNQICKSMNKWLKKYVEVGRREKLGLTQDLTETLANVKDAKKLYRKRRI